MPKTGRFPLLDAEPKSVKSYLGIAPPPYRSTSSHNFHEEDSASALWSEHSYNSGNGSATTTSGIGTGSSMGKRRASWTNLVEGDENYNKYKHSNNDVNPYPKVASTASSAYTLPQKVPTRIHSSSSNNTNFFTGINNGFLPSSHVLPSTRGPLLASRENSLTSSVVSDTFVYPKGSLYNYKLNESGPTMSPAGSVRDRVVLDPDPSQPPRVKKNRMEDIRQVWHKPITKLICLGILLLLMAGIIVAIVLSQVLVLPRHFQFTWNAPEIVARNASASVIMDVSGGQARFELTGGSSPLFKNNYVSIYDFNSNKISIIDSALRASGGGIKSYVCFIIDLNRQNIPDLPALQRAAKNAESRKSQTQGWVETWTFIPNPINQDMSQVFQPPIPECNGARWVQLQYTNTNQRNARCSDCYDFCLPEYGIERDVIRDESYLNIIRRDCFYMFVPEWRNYAASYTNPPQFPNQFGIQQPNQVMPGWPQNQNLPITNLQNQDYNNLNQFGAGGGGGVMTNGVNGFNNFNNMPNNQSTMNQETRWISVQNVPQQVANASEQAFNQFRQGLNQFGQNLGQGLNQIGQNVGQTLTNVGQNLGQTVGDLGQRIGQNTLLGQAVGWGQNQGQNDQNPDQTQLNVAGQVVQSGQRTFNPNGQQVGGQIMNYQLTSSGDSAQSAAANLGILGSNNPYQQPQNYPLQQGLDLMNTLNQQPIGGSNAGQQPNPFASNPFSNQPSQNGFNSNGQAPQLPQPVPQNFVPISRLTSFGSGDFGANLQSQNPIVYPANSQQSGLNQGQQQGQPARLSEILNQPSPLSQQVFGNQQQGQVPSGQQTWSGTGK